MERIQTAVSNQGSLTGKRGIAAVEVFFLGCKSVLFFFKSWGLFFNVS